MGAIGSVMRTALLVFLGAGVQPPQPAPAPPPTGLILGRVVDAATNRPVPGAIVALNNVGMVMPGSTVDPSRPRAMTNANGQFVFRRLPKGQFGLSVTKTGYVDGAYGRRRPGGSQTPVELEEGQRTGDVVIRIWRYASISGTVVDEAGEPLVGIQVRTFMRRLMSGERRLTTGAMAMTDDRGIYRFGSLMPGDYVVAFVSHEVSLPAATAEIMRNPNTNDPKTMEIIRERFNLGSTGMLGQSGIQTGGLVRQVDTGSPIPPAAPDSDAVYVYPTQFFPGVPSSARARVVTLESGQQREGVDFALHPRRAVRVSGVVVGPEGPVANTAMRLVPVGDEARTDLEASATMSGPSGEFTFLGVTAGQYAVKVLRVPPRAAPAPPSVTTQIQIGSSMIMSSAGPIGPSAPLPMPEGPTLFGDVPVAVADADVNDVIVTLDKGARLTGRFEFDGTRERPPSTDLVRYSVSLERADGASQGITANGVPPGRADESGAFKTFGVPPGKYLLRVGSFAISITSFAQNPAFGGWSLKSVTVEGRDVSDSPIDVGASDIPDVIVTFTDRPTKLTGSVRGRDGTPDRDALVILFPADPSNWSQFGVAPRRLRSTRPSKSGAYTFTGLPPGDYYVAAINEDGIAQWQDPQVLEEVSRSASPVKLVEGDTRTQDLKSGGGPR